MTFEKRKIWLFGKYHILLFETNYTVEVTAKRFNLGDGLRFSHGRKKVCIDYERTISFSLRFCFYFSRAVQVIGGIMV